MKGSIIVVNKSLPIKGGMLIVCYVDDELLTRKLCFRGNSKFLCINDNMDACINITGKEINIIGAVTWTCLPHNN
jgi:DNA polymerase V